MPQAGVGGPVGAHEGRGSGPEAGSEAGTCVSRVRGRLPQSHVLATRNVLGLPGLQEQSWSWSEFTACALRQEDMEGPT